MLPSYYKEYSILNGKIKTFIPNLDHKSMFFSIRTCHYTNSSQWNCQKPIAGKTLSNFHGSSHILITMVRKKNTAENFEKKIFELVKNIAFGKSVENLKNRVDQLLFHKRYLAKIKLQLIKSKSF